MNLLFVLGELNPQRPKGTAATCAAVAKALRGLGHKVTAVAPLLANVDPRAHALARRLRRLEITTNGETHVLDVYTGRTSNGLDLVYLGHDELFGETASLLDGAPAEVARRLGAFAAAVQRFVAANDGAFDAVQGLGIAGAASLASIASNEDAGAPVRVLALDDANETGAFPLECAALLGLGEPANDAQHVSVLKAALLGAERVVVSSTSIGKRLASDASEPGLAAAMARAGDRVHVVVPAIDGSRFNPLTDAHVPSRFDPVDRSGKERCRSVLLQELGLPLRADVPVLGVLVEPGDRRGFRAFADVARRVLRNDVSVIVGARTDAEEIAELDELADRWPDRIAVRRDVDDTFVHRLLAASDLFLRATQNAPSDVLPIAALRYGALPIIHRDHGAADAVVDCEPSLKTGSGFLFDSLDEEGLLATIRRAVDAASKGAPFEAVKQRAMRLDYSIERHARILERVYREAQRVRTEARAAAEAAAEAAAAAV